MSGSVFVGLCMVECVCVGLCGCVIFCVFLCVCVSVWCVYLFVKAVKNRKNS